MWPRLSRVGEVSNGYFWTNLFRESDLVKRSLHVVNVLPSGPVGVALNPVIDHPVNNRGGHALFGVTIGLFVLCHECKSGFR